MKRKKFPKLPNGYGSIRYLGSGRRNAYAVHPPTTDFTLNGTPCRPPAICYVDSWYKGFSVLTAYRSGSYYPGYELTLHDPIDQHVADQYIAGLLKNYSSVQSMQAVSTRSEKSFSDVYDLFYKWKYDGKKKYSQSAKNATRHGFNYCAPLHDKIFTSIKHADLQRVIDMCPLKHASKELIVVLLHQMYEYAVIYEIVDKDISQHLRISDPDDDESGIPFSEDDLRLLWQHAHDPLIRPLVIMCYSGFRISELVTLSIDIDNLSFTGGVKTAAGKNRIVPIHSSIVDLVREAVEGKGKILPYTPNAYRPRLYEKMDAYGISRHTPHDCRHTFSMLCEKYGVNPVDQKRMMGHAIHDITAGTYGHRSLEDLRAEIEKIPGPVCD